MSDIRGCDFDVEPTFCICDRSYQLHYILSQVAKNQVHGPYYCHHCYQNPGDKKEHATADEIMDLYKNIVEEYNRLYTDADTGASFLHPLQMRDSLGLTPIEVINIYIPLLSTCGGHSRKAMVLHEVAKRMLGLPGLPVVSDDLRQYPILPERGCLRCGCSNEFDAVNDRICFCDRCKTPGCWYSGMHYAYKCETCNDAVGNQ